MSLMFLMPYMMGAAGGEPPISWSEDDVITFLNSTAGQNCYAIIEVSSDGKIWSNRFGGAFQSTGYDEGDWLNYGSSADYYAIVSSTGGSPGTFDWGNELNTRAQLSTDRHFGCQATGTLENHSVQYQIDFYDAPTGGNLVHTGTGTLTAFEDTP